MKLKENDKIPNSEIFVIEGDDPVKRNIEEYLKNKKVIIFLLVWIIYISFYILKF